MGSMGQTSRLWSRCFRVLGSCCSNRFEMTEHGRTVRAHGGSITPHERTKPQLQVAAATAAAAVRPAMALGSKRPA